MAEKRYDELWFAALGAVRAANELADEIDQIVDESLPANASRALRAHLRRIALRQRDIAAALGRELDNPDPDPELVRHLTGALRRAAALFAAGAIFATGALATGALEDLGADLKDSLLQRVSAVDNAGAEVETMLEIERPPPADSSPPQLAELLAALESGDRKTINRELAFLAELEYLLREAIVVEARRAYGKDWLAVLNRQLDASESPSQLTLSNLTALIARMERDGNLPPVLRGWAAEGEVAAALRQVVQLRNDYAHGRVGEQEWRDQFLAKGGRDLLADSVDLYARLGEDG